MSIPINVRGTIIDFPSSGQNPNYAPAIIQFAEAVSNAFESTLVINTQTSNYVVTVNDDIIRADATGGPMSVTLPTPSLAVGKIFYIQKIDSSPNPVTVVGTINGQTNFVLNNQYELIQVYSDGTSYQLINHTILQNVTILTKNSNYLITASDSLIRGDASSGSIALTLPDPTTVIGKFYYLIKIDSSSNTVTIAGTINGVSNFILTKQYQAIIVYSNGTNYEIIAKSLGLTNADLSGSAGITGANIASATITNSNIASGTILNSNLAGMPSNTLKGNNTGGSTVLDLTISQINTMLGTAISVGPVNNTSTADGMDLTSGVLSLHATDGINPGILNTVAQTIGGDKTFFGDIFIYPGSSMAIGATTLGPGQTASSLYIKPSSSGLSPSNPTAAPLLIETDGSSQGAFVGFITPTNAFVGLQVNEGTMGGGAQFRYKWTGTASTSGWFILGNSASALGSIASDSTWTIGQASSSVTHKINGASSNSVSSGGFVLPAASGVFIPINFNGTTYKIALYFA